MQTQRSVRWIAVLLLFALTVIPTAPAHAATPTWSGLDARFYADPIPRQGVTIASVPLDPTLSLSGAGPAYRVL